MIPPILPLAEPAACHERRTGLEPHAAIAIDQDRSSSGTRFDRATAEACPRGASLSRSNPAATRHSPTPAPRSATFAGCGDQLKTRGAEFEKRELSGSRRPRRQNDQFTSMSTAIVSQADRNLHQALGQTKADVAGASFAGSALDLLRESASAGVGWAVACDEPCAQPAWRA